MTTMRNFDVIFDTSNVDNNTITIIIIIIIITVLLIVKYVQIDIYEKGN
jgi:hypothetical protein